MKFELKGMSDIFEILLMEKEGIIEDRFHLLIVFGFFSDWITVSFLNI